MFIISFIQFKYFIDFSNLQNNKLIIKCALIDNELTKQRRRALEYFIEFYLLSFILLKKIRSRKIFLGQNKDVFHV